MSSDEAASFDWAMLYWFWLHWGQYASTTKASDVEELRNLISIFYSNPGVRLCWENSPWAKPVLEKDFVNFVDEILIESEGKRKISVKLFTVKLIGDNNVKYYSSQRF